MSILIMALWALGFAFLAILWLGFAMSLFEMAQGLLRRDMGTRVSGSTWRKGLLAGTIGYAVVVVLFSVFNLLEGESVFRTPALLGQSLLGEQVGNAIVVAPVVIYNGLHLVTFLALGLATAWFLFEWDRYPKISFPGFVLLVVVFLHAIGIVLVLALPAGSAIPAWSVLIASAAAGIAMAGYLVSSRPDILALLRAVDAEA